MELDLIRPLFDFHYWARDRLLSSVAGLTEAQHTQPVTGGWGSIRETLAHSVEAEEIWFSRIRGHSLSSLKGAVDMPAFAAMKARWAASEATIKAYLRACDAAELNRVVRYTNTKGQAFTTPVWQILLHIVNHATEHRSQVASMLTQLGIDHPGMDMITFWRGE